MIADILQNINAFVDGRGFLGQVSELVPPKLMPLLEEYDAGGLSAVVDIPMGGHEKLEAETTINVADGELPKLFGVTLGATIPFTFRATTIDDDGETHAIAIAMRGVIKEFDPGTWKRGESAKLKLGLTLRYYKYERDGDVLVECDPTNMVMIVNGVDQLAEQRAALGA